MKKNSAKTPSVKTFVEDAIRSIMSLPAEEQDRIWEKIAQERNGAKPALPQFEFDDYVYMFSDEFDNEPVALYATKDNRLFLADIEQDKVTKLRPATLVECLDWYCRLVPFSIGGSGTVALLCKLASEQLKGAA